MTHDITLTSASTEMGFTLSSIWGFVVAKLLALIYDVPHKTRVDTRKGSWDITLEYLFLVFLIVSSAGDITFPGQKVLVTWTKQFCAPVCTLPTPTCLPSGAICFSQLAK